MPLRAHAHPPLACSLQWLLGPLPTRSQVCAEACGAQPFSPALLRFPEERQDPGNALFPPRPTGLYGVPIDQGAPPVGGIN